MFVVFSLGIDLEVGVILSLIRLLRNLWSDACTLSPGWCNTLFPLLDDLFSKFGLLTQYSADAAHTENDYSAYYTSNDEDRCKIVIFLLYKSELKISSMLMHDFSLTYDNGFNLITNYLFYIVSAWLIVDIVEFKWKSSSLTYCMINWHPDRKWKAYFDNFVDEIVNFLALCCLKVVSHHEVNFGAGNTVNKFDN